MENRTNLTLSLAAAGLSLSTRSNAVQAGAFSLETMPRLWKHASHLRAKADRPTTCCPRPSISRITAGPGLAAAVVGLPVGVPVKTVPALVWERGTGRDVTAAMPPVAVLSAERLSPTYRAWPSVGVALRRSGPAARATRPATS